TSTACSTAICKRAELMWSAPPGLTTSRCRISVTMHPAPKTSCPPGLLRGPATPTRTTQPRSPESLFHTACKGTNHETPDPSPVAHPGPFHPALQCCRVYPGDLAFRDR